MVEFGLPVLIALLALCALYALRLRRANADLTRENQELAQANQDAGRLMASAAARETAIAQAVTDALIVVDPARQVAYLNDSARNILAIDNAIGRRFSEVAWGFDLAPLLDEALAGKIETIQQTVVHEGRAFLAQARPIGEHADYGAVIALREVTELQRLGRARRDFVANISHELRTPIASVKLLADTLAQGAWRDSQVAPNLLGKIDAEVDALQQLADELFELAQIESGQMPLRLTEAELSALVAKTLTRFAVQAERRQIALRVEPMDGMAVLVDAAKFERVLGNLVHNALKFTPPGGSVRIGARPAGDMVELCVADTGLGIPAADVPRVFERFYKVDRARTRGDKGTGLGLAIAKHIVEAHGGKIWVESIEGAGAAFYFTLPKG